MKARPATLVVIEFGASWPRWLNPTGDRGDLAVVAQHYAGLPSDLITQVAMRVTRLQSRGWQLGAMVLVSNGRADVPTAAARSILARGLLAHLAASGGGSFALSVDAYLGRRAAHNLQALAVALEPVARVSRVELRLERGAQSRDEPVAGALTA
jgi:predicted amidohydrolase